MNLSTNTVFKIIEIAKQFNVIDLQHSLLESMGEFFENFPTFVESEEFLKLSRETLENVLSRNLTALDEVSLLIAALKCVKCQCSNKEQTQNGENWRHALGPALFQIRFPLMTLTEFSNVVGTTGILSGMEEFKIAKFISLSEQNRLTFDVCNFPFKTEIRKCGAASLPGVKTVKILEDSQIVESPQFECKEDDYGMWLQVDKSIAIESVGF